MQNLIPKFDAMHVLSDFSFLVTSVDFPFVLPLPANRTCPICNCCINGYILGFFAAQYLCPLLITLPNAGW